MPALSVFTKLFGSYLYVSSIMYLLRLKTLADGSKDHTPRCRILVGSKDNSPSSEQGASILYRPISRGLGCFLGKAGAHVFLTNN